MHASARLTLALSLMIPPLPALATGLPQASARPGEHRAGDDGPYVRLREFFFHESRPEPLREKYEELFGEPYPEEGFHQHRPFRPFEDVQRFNNAYELRGIAGARANLAESDSAITLEIELPGTAQRSLAVRVDEEKVSLSVGSSAQPRRWFVSRGEEHVLALPNGALPDTAKVKRDGDLLHITFERDGQRRTR